jgi:Ribonucleotide reductase, alpha subunit
MQFGEQGYDRIDFRTYDTDWDSEAYLTVSGQNSNNSVRIPNEFIHQVQADGEWKLYRRTDGKVAKTLPARELWEKISGAAWACADPGCNTTPPSTSGIPARPAGGSTPPTPAPNTCSWTIRPATWRP